MAKIMTRVEAICACRNIVRLAEANEKVPATMAAGIIDRANSMEQSIIDRAQYPNITDKMDTALRNMWSGLRKWDRSQEYADDLFEDLEETEKEMADYDASQGNVVAKAPPKGRETSDDAVAKARESKYAATLPRNTEAPEPEEEEATMPVAPVASVASHTAARNAAVSCALSAIHAAPITVIAKDKLRDMSMGDLQALTTSDRTQQLLRAAYHVGVLRGIALLDSILNNAQNGVEATTAKT